MKLVGVRVAERNVLVLAQRLRAAGENTLADTLEDALIGGYREVPLETTSDRVAILAVLEDCPDELEPLRQRLQTSSTLKNA